MDYEDVKMRLFAQRLSREAKNWYKYLPVGSIQDRLQSSKLNSWIDGTIRRVHYKSRPSIKISRKEVLSRSMSSLADS